MKIGILGTADIAFRRFLPALQDCSDVIYAGVASRTWEKAASFVETFGGQAYDGYEALLADPSIDAVYVPLPPALHFKWGKRALEAGKHLMMEKPFTTSLSETEFLLKLAEENGLAVHENYAFVYHSQLNEVQKLLAEGAIGEFRLIRVDFGFPFRGAADFRYDKELGGGALLDCGGYTLKMASHFLGKTARVTSAQLNGKKGSAVDVYGSGTLTSKEGLTAQVSFGMDNIYRCSLEVWGSQGTLFTNRVLTAPAGYAPEVVIKRAEGEQIIKLPADDTFRKSITHFAECMHNEVTRVGNCEMVHWQSKLMEEFIQCAS